MLLGSIFFLTGCQEDDQTTLKTEEISTLENSDPSVKREVDFLYQHDMIDSVVYEQLLQLPADQVLQSYDKEEDGKMIYVEFYRVGKSTDMDGTTIQRDVLQEMMEESVDMQNNTSMRMKRHTHMFDSGGGTITCRAFITSGNGRVALTSAWRTALEDAVDEWNALDLNVNFVVVNASNTNIVGGYINVFGTPMAGKTNWWAGTDLPGDPGYFGERLMVNTTTTNPDPTADAKKKMMVHELGHAIGFQHTNASTSSTIFATDPTCNENSSTHSFMHSTQTYNEGWAGHGFTACDLTNLNYYWW